MMRTGAKEMIKAIFSEVLRVGRTTALAVGVALMVALTVGLASAALAGTGVGARFPGPKSQRPAARVPASLHATKRYGQPDEREARTLKRNIPRTILAALALGLLLLGCGESREGAQQQGDSQEESAQEPVAGEFVGFARDAQGVAGIAAIADPVLSEGGARDVKVYYCDGAQTAEWFRDSSDGYSIDFTSEDGDASVLATLTEELVTGTITLAEGRTLDFEAAPANGLAGLYPSEVTERFQRRFRAGRPTRGREGGRWSHHHRHAAQRRVAPFRPAQGRRGVGFGELPLDRCTRFPGRR
jgi:hypothetical protein